MADSIGTEERRWLFALARGRLSGQAVDRNMPAPVRDALVARGLVAWADASFGLTTQGKREVERLRSRPEKAASARPAPAQSESIAGEVSEAHLKWLEAALSQRLRGEVVSWNAIPDAIRAPLESGGFIWRFEDQTEIDLRAVRALTKRGIRWTDAVKPGGRRP